MRGAFALKSKNVVGSLKEGTMIGKVDEADGSNKRKLKSPASLLQPILLGKLRKEKSKTKTGNLVKN